ncbi:molybdopterin/thiamine biosynthesis adenylyltransferase [Neisseria sp. HSC-16F19]|nr:HesA/MoeB/ThiF family protein [Neisseria sp. HSC-16F19]MCP2039864.1 molybdopterin/thiamine biosynthesis adenylyltransferase [Neisseria sp. HSC-16F19]
MDDTRLLRYSRHIMLDEIDMAGQERLQQASVLVLGCGGLGAAALPYLAASGVGRLIIADDDKVEWSNLQRQISYTEADVDRAKVAAMRDYLHRLNSDVHITALEERLDEAALLPWVAEADVVLDCSDNAATRHALNRACVATGTDLVAAAAVRFGGQLCLLRPGQADSPCYACVFGDALFDDGACALFGVFAPLVGVVGTAQAALALRVLLGIGDTEPGVLQQYDGLSGRWQFFQAARNPQCPVCGV